MNPLYLRISGFLSYREPVELDFTPLKVACISGQNGAGKSSLLDSITWTLFGEARGKGAEIINLHPDVRAAEVALTFEYEGNVFRVQRTLPRGKSTQLEFQVRQGEGWKPLTEKTTRETQARIEGMLRLDYETFINASFFLQGKADQFTQKKAGERKAVLGAILGLEVWDVYKERSAKRRRTIEGEILEIEGRLTEIDSELAEEDLRRTRLVDIEERLRQLASVRAAQEASLETMRRNAALAEEQRKTKTALAASLERSCQALASLDERLVEKRRDLEHFAGLVDRANEIETAFEAWEKVRTNLGEWDKAAFAFREYHEQRSPFLEEIASERARLEQEQRTLTENEAAIKVRSPEIDELSREIEEAQARLEEAQAGVDLRAGLEIERNAGREKLAALKAENEGLKAEMLHLKDRIEALKSARGAACPLCGQELSRDHRKTTLHQLEGEGREMGDRFRANKAAGESLEAGLAALESRLLQLAGADQERIRHSNAVSQRSERRDSLRSLSVEWERTGRKRLIRIDRQLAGGRFAAEARRKLKEIDKELTRLGYDAAAHDAMRRQELELRVVEEQYRALDKARELQKRTAEEIEVLQDEMTSRQREVEELRTAHEAAAQALAASEAIVPELRQAEARLYAMREEENRARDQAGAARQKVEVLAVLQARRTDLAHQHENLNQKIARHRALERAFGRDGVPALLIEQSLPQIETKANDLLERLSGGQLSIRFVTQAEYRDRKREDLKETLDISISDPAGARAYEMYSGGEAFRVNFAIRLALSEILAQRKGARLQTLVIDEGFGSQDAQGRQRLLEAIHMIQKDFEKILVITHLEELKDAFPNRIEVEKTERGSTVRII